MSTTDDAQPEAPIESIDPAPPYVASTPSARRWGRRGITGIAVTLALVAGGFGVMQLTAADGPQSPEAAVRSFFDAVDHEDVIGVIESLDPSERQILRDAVESTKSEAARTEVASKDLDLNKVQGVDLEVSDLKMGVAPLREGLSAVDLADGHVSTSADLDRMAIGPVIHELLTRRAADPDLKGEDHTAKSRIDLSGVRLASTRTDGAWHVSILYSIAEQVRTNRDHVKPFPTAPPIAAKGADSPEAAVRQAIDALLHHDAQRLIELAAPGEMDVLHTYGPMIVANAKKGWAQESESTTVKDLGLTTTDGPRGAKIVSATSFKMHDEHDYGDGDGGDSTDYVFDGRCTSITSTSTYADSGWSDYPPVEGDSGGWTNVAPNAGVTSSTSPDGASPDPQSHTTKWCKGEQGGEGARGVLPSMVFMPFFFNGSSGADLKVVTEEHDGAWFVSPARSLFETSLSGLRGLSVDDARRQVRALFGNETWLLDPPEFWKACKVEQPGLEATRADGEKAEQACADALPDDYQGPYGFGGYARSKFSTVGRAIDDSGSYDDPTSSCDNEPAVIDAEGSAYDVAYSACLERLFAEGKIDGSVLVDDQCGSAWNDWYNAHPDSDGPTDAESQALDDAHQACVDATPVPSRPGGSAPAPVLPGGAGTSGSSAPSGPRMPSGTKAPADANAAPAAPAPSTPVASTVPAN